MAGRAELVRLAPAGRASAFRRYRKGNTWLYRRNYPKDIAAVFGSQASKQSLNTSDVRTARVRAAEVNARYEAQVQRVLSGAEQATQAAPESIGWEGASIAAVARRPATLEHSRQVPFERGQPKPTVAVGALGRRYLLRRQGFADTDACWQWLTDYIVHRRPP